MALDQGHPIPGLILGLDRQQPATGPQMGVINGFTDAVTAGLPVGASGSGPVRPQRRSFIDTRGTRPIARTNGVCRWRFPLDWPEWACAVGLKGISAVTDDAGKGAP